MAVNRRYVLGSIVVILGVVTGAILLEVLGTILFAFTVAYVLLPVHRWLVRRGIRERHAAVGATLIGFLSVVVVLSPILFTLSVRLEAIVGFVEQMPEVVSVTIFEETIAVETADVQRFLVDYLTSLAFTIASDLPVLAIKFALFVILLFAVVLKGEAAGRAAIAPVPHEYRDVVYALAKRARETLYAIYVLQVATSVSTLLLGYPLFWLLGYDSPLTLAVIAAILQFIPIIGPSLLIVPIAIYHVVVGEVVAAALVTVLGVGLIAWFPDVVVRPRLAYRSAGLPGSLYFVGFTGGLFTMGAIGIVVGPLIVAVFVEAVELLSEEVNTDRTFTELATDAITDESATNSELAEESEREVEPMTATEAEAEAGGETNPAHDHAHAADSNDSVVRTFAEDDNDNQ